MHQAAKIEIDRLTFFFSCTFHSNDFCTSFKLSSCLQVSEIQVAAFIQITLRVSSLIQSLSFSDDDPDKSSFEPNKAQN